MVNGQACAFTTSVLHIYQIPYVHIHLEYPTELFTTFVRKAIRVETKVEATVVNRSIGDRARKIECYLADISETGAHLVTPIRIGKTGDSIDLVLSLNIGGMKRILNVPSILRRRLKAKTASDEREVHYGVEFLPLDDMERLEMIAFVYSKYSELG
jgi:c-di-GMP-binding flagellar brake protein YcgR